MRNCLVCNSLFDHTSPKEASPRSDSECLECYQEDKYKKFKVEFTASIVVEAQDEEQAEEIAQASLTGAEMETNIEEVSEE